MFDFSPSGILVAIAIDFMTSLSLQAVIGVLGAVAAAALAGASGSPVARGVWLGLAIALGVSAGSWQAASTAGAAKMMARDHALALRAERERADKAEAITRDLADQSTRDLAEARADASKLKELNDVLAKNGRRDGVCLDRDLARRLRAL